MDPEYITIKEFAQRANKSPQAIYKRLNNQLSTYVKLVDNQKKLNIQALQDIYGIKVDNQIQPKVEKVDNQIQPDSQPIIELLKDELETLREQLAIKDRQISELNERLAEAHKALDQAQHLQAMAEQKINFLENKRNDNTEPEQPGDESDRDEQLAPKRGFLKRIFKKYTEQNMG